MAVGDVVCNWSKGRNIEWADLAKTSAAGEAIVVVLFKATGLPSDAVLVDCKFLSDVLAAGAAEANFTFTGSRRKVISGAGITVTVDTTANEAWFDLPDLTWEAAGGALNNDFGKIGVFFRRLAGDTDSAIRCISFHNYVGSTTGLNLEAVITKITSDA